MCLAVPVRIEALLPDSMARVSFSGVSKVISVALIDDLSVGDYVILHVGYALSRIDPDEAARSLALLAELGQMEEALNDWQEETPP